MESFKNNVSQCTKVIRVFKRPVIIKKHALFKNPNSLIKRNTTPLYREDLIYESTGNDFLKGEFPPFKLVNILNVVTNSSRTVVRYNSNVTDTVEKTSDNITRLIGQKNYDTIFSALLSVINIELKIRSMLGLLQEKTIHKDVACSTVVDGKLDADVRHTQRRDIYCQTNETSMNNLKQSKQTRRLKRHKVKPYIVKDTEPEDKCQNIKTFIVHCSFSSEITPNLKEKRSDPIEITQADIKQETVEHTVEKIDNISHDSDDLPDLKLILDEDSIVSNGSIGNISLSGLSTTNSILSIIEKCTNAKTSCDDNFNPSVLKIIDGSEMIIPVKPEDVFHIATPEILKNVTHDEKRKLLMQQAYYDWKYCLVKGDDNNFPVHLAVLNNDLDLLRRQCQILREVHGSVDVTTDANLTPLQMAIQHNSWPECTSLLLRHGADPLATDEEYRTPLHLAAEGDPLHLKAIIDFCKTNARQVLKDNEDLWRDEFQHKSDEQLATFLLRRMCQACDSQGYTPLMLCARQGGAAAARLLLAAAPSAVNAQAPGSGDTALYLVISAACLHADETSDQSKVPAKYTDTIEVLLEHGADPSIDNHSGCNVNTLLTETNVSELSMLIANKMTTVKYFSGESAILPHAGEPYILVKEQNGDISLQSVESKATKILARSDKSTVTTKCNIQVLDPKTISARDELTLRRDESTLRRDEPTLSRNEPTLRRDELTLRRGEPTSRRDEPTLRRDGSTMRRDDLTLRRDESTLRRDGSTMRRDEPNLRRDESTLRRDKSTLKRDESILRRDELTLRRHEPTLRRYEPTLRRDETKSEVKLEKDIIKPVILANVPVAPRVNAANPSGLTVDRIKSSSDTKMSKSKVKNENSPRLIVDIANNIIFKRQHMQYFPPANGESVAKRITVVGAKRNTSETGEPGTSKVKKTN